MKQRICNWARRRLPPGLEPEGELKLMAGSLAVMALISAVGFSGRLESGIQALYRVLGQDRKVLWPEARMIPFYQLLPETAVFFAAVALAFGLWLGLWLYCRQGAGRTTACGCCRTGGSFSAGQRPCPCCIWRWRR